MAASKGITICNNRKSEKVLMRGWATKSPPNDKLKKKNFRDRWFTMSTIELCSDCQKTEDATTALVLLYFADDTQANLKGMS